MFDNILKGLQGTLGGILGKTGNPLSGIDTDNILDKIKGGAKTAGRETTKMGLELWYVMKAKETSTMDKVIIGGALAYQFLPNDVLSTKDYGVLGTLDNALALGVAYNRMKKHVTPEIEAQVEAQLAQWFAPKDAPAAETTPELTVQPAPVAEEVQEPTAE